MFPKPCSAAPRIPEMPVELPSIMWHAPGLLGAAAAGPVVQTTAAAHAANSKIRLRNITLLLRRLTLPPTNDSVLGPWSPYDVCRILRR